MEITDEMVEVALDTWFNDDGNWKNPSKIMPNLDLERFVTRMRREMRLTLEAAFSLNSKSE